MTQPQPLTHSDSQSAPPSTQEASAAATPVVGHQTAGLVVIPRTAEGVVVGMQSLGADGVTSPLELMHSESGQPLLWADVACSNKVAAVSGWFPGKLGGWVKLDWRDGGFAADAWSSDGAGMTAYDAAMRAAKKRA
jgi:hypothetical protein